MQKETKLVLVKTSQLYPHPDNPRKEIGDISEMVESVKKNGIMQNLTIMPLSCLDEEVEKQPAAEDISLLSDFIVLIGHRRLSAAKEAGLQDVPCRIISKISKKEQVSIMLEENMQRNDLTIYEQAQGFQMMLDLGETAETIAEKTGFSTSTIYHRLNIAKLNQKELQKKQNDGSFQLTLQDLYELEKIQNIKTRNKVLKEATDSRNLAARARDAARNEKREKAAKEIQKMIQKLNIPVTQATDYVWYNSSRYDRVQEINLDGKIPEKLKIKGDGPFFYQISGASFYIVKKAEKKEKKKTPTDILWEKREKNKKQLKAIVKKMDKRRRQFVLDIISGEIEPIKLDLRDILWQQLLESGTGIYRSTLFKFYTEKETYNCAQEEKEEGNKWVDRLSVLQQMLILYHNALNGVEPFDYYSKFDKAKADKYISKLDVLVMYGWYFTEEEQKLLDGTHELYEKKEEKA